MRPILAAAAACTLLPVPAAAHVTLDPPQATAGGHVRAALRVPHGCAGGVATTAVEVTIPDGVFSARPMPKPGWRLTVERRHLDGAVLAPGPLPLGWREATRWWPASSGRAAPYRTSTTTSSC